MSDISNSAYGAIVTDDELGKMFIDLANRVKNKQESARKVASWFAENLLHEQQYQNPHFIIDLYECLTIPQLRKSLIAGIAEQKRWEAKAAKSKF